MKNGTHSHGSREIEEISANRILKELYEHRKENEDGKVHVHEIKEGHIEKEFVSY